MDSSPPVSRCSTELGSEEAGKLEAVLSKAGLLYLKHRFVREKVRESLSVIFSFTISCC